VRIFSVEYHRDVEARALGGRAGVLAAAAVREERERRAVDLVRRERLDAWREAESMAICLLLQLWWGLLRFKELLESLRAVYLFRLMAAEDIVCAVEGTIAKHSSELLRREYR
jgi:hypothetical protein